MAKRALGANWRRRTPQEQEEFVRLFTDVLERAYADIIESYTDEKIVYVSERIDGNYRRCRQQDYDRQRRRVFDQLQSSSGQQ